LSSTIERSYATGAVTGTESVGGLVGGIGLRTPDPTALTSYWDVATSGQASSQVGTGKTTAEMKALGTFSAGGWAIAQGWSTDASKTWGICAGVNGGYPYLLRQFTSASETCSVAPGAPTALKAKAGDGSIVLSWGAPASDGGLAVTSYVATAHMQERVARSCTAVAPATSCTIAGLANGRDYTVSVAAVNRRGTGAAVVSAKVMPRSSLVVVSTQRSGRSVATRVRVSGAGKVTQVGTAAGALGVVCRSSVAVKAAGVVTVRCVLSGAAKRSLQTGGLRVRLVTRFVSSNGMTQSVTRVVRFARPAPAPVVTG
jgi:hypothetical protein